MLMSSVVMAALFAAAPAKPAPSSWKVTGSDVTFEMSGKDLRALRGGSEVFGLQSRKKGFLADLKPDPDDDRDQSDWEAHLSFDVLSVVGTLVSYEESSAGYTGGAHPYDHRGYVLEDVTKKGKDTFSLLTAFPEKDVLKALKADGFVKKHVRDEKAFADAKTVEALMESLDAGEDCVGFEYGLDNVKRSVAFHHLEGDKVAVRIAFGYAAESCRGNMFVVGVLLPIPADLKPALERASTRQEGFLMKDAKAARAPSVSFDWEGSAPKPKKP
jgi:hypothetical protein